MRQDGRRSARVALATGADVPNRDLVLDTRFKSIEPQVLAGRGKDGAGRFRKGDRAGASADLLRIEGESGGRFITGLDQATCKVDRSRI